MIATTWPALDAVLPGGGWPRGVLTELFTDHYGIGEIRLLLPALARIAKDGDPQAWVAPPFLLHAPAFAAAGLDLGQLLIVRPSRRNDLAWSIETCLRTEGCGAVVAWPPTLSMMQLRRLQLAAASSGACAFLFRSAQERGQASPAALRMVVHPASGGMKLELFKMRGGSPLEVFVPWER